MRHHGRLCKKAIVDGTAADDILIWDGDSWEPGVLDDIADCLPAGVNVGDVLSWDGDSWESVDIDTLVTSIGDGTAAGQMLFWNGANWVYTETSELFWDDTNKRIGINKTVPTSTLDVGGTVTMTRLLAGGVHEE